MGCSQRLALRLASERKPPRPIRRRGVARGVTGVPLGPQVEFVDSKVATAAMNAFETFRV